MTLTQIKYFVKTAETCNFTQAAAELYITQQVLSRQIQALEKEIGFSLFHRENKRHVELTEAGQLMFDTWQPLLEQTEVALAQAATLANKRTLRIGVPNIAHVLDPVIAVVQNYIQTQDDYDVEFVVESSNRIRWMFEKKELDMLIAFSINTADLQEDFHSEWLKRMEFGAICNKKHPFAKKEVLTAKDLDRQTICMFNESYAKNIEKNMLDIFKRAGIKPRKIKRFDNWQNMALSLELDKGINLGFRAFVQEQRGLVYVPIDSSIWNDEIWLMAFVKNDTALPLLKEIKKVF